MAGETEMKTASASKPPRVKSRRRAQTDDARFRASLGMAAWIALYGKRGP
jgi:hypothetical protein